ncbi:hypothetical protein [Bradyrhizobium arachidis]|uniref:Uncharacterized protein n=1 Tax=Bradyrhizobium arachidis TaxID=858423 RepID=A0AAE7NNX8_9BRAD|nr:hypothetical protein [Bradyrhizobium arachidis]QOZ68907.1 hypothetical protein WN72_23190 [Bradyrhizobium arachidis]SFV19451.1 hypothetical protein SAMN05192541_15132 [Bradyrhizobium arachidis]
MPDIDIKALDKAIIESLLRMGMKHCHFTVVIEDHDGRTTAIGTNNTQPGGPENMLVHALIVMATHDSMRPDIDEIGPVKGSA